MRLGTRFAMPRRAASLAQGADGVFTLGLEDGEEVRTRSLVIARGVQYRRRSTPTRANASRPSTCAPRPAGR